jgi:hypothetical protein
MDKNNKSKNRMLPLAFAIAACNCSSELLAGAPTLTPEQRKIADLTASYLNAGVVSDMNIATAMAVRALGKAPVGVPTANRWVPTSIPQSSAFQVGGVSADFGRALTAGETEELAFILWNVFRGEWDLLVPNAQALEGKTNAVKRLCELIYGNAIAGGNVDMTAIAALSPREQELVNGLIALVNAFDNDSVLFRGTPSFSRMDPTNGNVLLPELANVIGVVIPAANGVTQAEQQQFVAIMWAANEVVRKYITMKKANRSSLEKRNQYGVFEDSCGCTVDSVGDALKLACAKYNEKRNDDFLDSLADEAYGVVAGSTGAPDHQSLGWKVVRQLILATVCDIDDTNSNRAVTNGNLNQWIKNALGRTALDEKKQQLCVFIVEIAMSAVKSYFDTKGRSFNLNSPKLPPSPVEFPPSPVKFSPSPVKEKDPKGPTSSRGMSGFGKDRRLKTI